MPSTGPSSSLSLGSARTDPPWASVRCTATSMPSSRGSIRVASKGHAPFCVWALPQDGHSYERRARLVGTDHDDLPRQGAAHFVVELRAHSPEIVPRTPVDVPRKAPPGPA